MRRFHFATVSSTNSEAQSLLERKTELPFFLSADEQTLGRGRSGREWISPKGNFYGTFALDARKSDLEMAQVSLVAAVSVAKVFS
ncbi:MAG: bifunctional biotin--[acetyl-CoA-carboxylase] synthetase/biotin operon repressor, partial [Alphaproteobacteria bacterium]